MLDKASDQRMQEDVRECSTNSQERSDQSDGGNPAALESDQGLRGDPWARRAATGRKGAR